MSTPEFLGCSPCYELARKHGISVDVPTVDGKLGSTPLVASDYPQVNFELRSVSLSAVPEPDPDQIYLVPLAFGQHENRSITLHTPGGTLLTSAESGVTDTRIEDSFRLLELLGGVALHVKSLGASTDAKEVLAGMVKSVGNHAKVGEAAARILQVLAVRKSIEMLRSGKYITAQTSLAALTKEEMELHLAQARLLESEYLGAFTGKLASEKDRTFEFEYLPAKLSKQSSIKFFELSQPQSVPGQGIRTRGGILFGGDHSDAAVTCKTPIDDSFLAPPWPLRSLDPRKRDKLTINLEIPSGQAFQVLKSSIGPSQPTLPPEDKVVWTGFPYRLAARVRVRALRSDVSASDGEQLHQSEVKIAQLGEIRTLPQEMVGRHSKFTFDLDPATGELTKISVNAESGIKESREAFGGLVDKYGEYKEKSDELTKLKREKELLELRKAVRELRAQQ